MTDLPEHVTDATTGHTANHAALKVDYDTRHPDQPLPELDGRRTPLHVEIHRLLAADHNALHPNPLPTELHQHTGGHNRDHAVLHAGYNQRHP